MLSGGRRLGDGVWMRICPAHDDRTASLKVTAGDGGRVLINCFAGCSPDQILGAMGLQMSDLFAEQHSTRWAPRPRGPRVSVSTRGQLDATTSRDPARIKLVEQLKDLQRRARTLNRRDQFLDDLAWYLAIVWEGAKKVRERRRQRLEHEATAHIPGGLMSKLNAWIDSIAR